MSDSKLFYKNTSDCVAVACKLLKNECLHTICSASSQCYDSIIMSPQQIAEIEIIYKRLSRPVVLQY